MDNPITTPAGSGPAASLPGTQDRAGRGDPALSPPPLPRPGAVGGGSGDEAQRFVKQGAAEIGREAHDVKDSVKNATADAAGKARDAATETARQAKAQAGQLAAQFKEKGATLVDEQKTRAADLIGDCVAATRRAAQKLHDENDHNLAGYADAFAEGLDSTARYLRETDPRRLVDGAADLARRRPEWVLGGMFVAGLAIARFLKASRPEGAAYGSYRYDAPRPLDPPAGYGGGYGGGNYGGTYDEGYGASYGGGGGSVREYGSSLGSQGDAFGERPVPSAPSLSGATPGTLDNPGIATTATGSWTATGAAGTTGAAPAVGGPDPTSPAAATTPRSINLDPAVRDNPEAL